MHTVTCVRTLSIGPRRHGPRLCVFRLCVAKVALRRPRSRERRCPVAASRCHRTKSALLATFQGGRAAKSSWCRKKGLHPARPTGGRAGTAMAHSSRAPTPARAPKHRSLADFKPSVALGQKKWGSVVFGWRALRPPRVVFALGFVSLINSLISGKIT